MSKLQRLFVLVVPVYLQVLGHAVWGQTKPDEIARARTLLAARGLTPSGNVWITKREAALKRTVESLEALERRHQQAIAKADEALAANEVIRGRLAQAEADDRGKNGRPEPLSRDPPISYERIPTLSIPPAKLNSQMPDVTGIGEQSPLQLAMIELVSARTAVQLAVLAIKRDAAQLEAEYQPLKSDDRVQTALKQINSNARLGPVHNYQRDVVRAETIATSAFKPDIPGYIESGQFRVAAILNEAHPVTCSFQARGVPLLLTSSVAQRLGLGPGDFVEPAREVLVGARRVAAHPVHLASMRLGSISIKDVTALVLPPEAEDFGSQISATALTGYQAILQERRMVVSLAPLPSK